MQVGVTVQNLGGFPEPDSGVQGCLQVAEHADRLGFDSVWVVDHVVLPAAVASRYPYNTSGVPGFDWRMDVYDPLVLMSALAQRTSRVQIGVAVLVLPYRHPLMVAKMLATADRLSGGRIILGAGVGWLREEFDALGLPPEHFTRRGAVTDDYIRAMKEAWLNTGPSRYTGEFVRFTDVGTFPHPRRTPHIPIWAGGKGRRALRRAVRLCDGYLGIASDPAALRAEVAELHRLAELDRRDPEELTVALSTRVTLTREPAPPGGAALTGTAAQLVERIHQYADAGLTHLIAGVRAAGESSLGATLEAMETFARDVLPVVRREVRP
jgi:probable F420-dependent oxidoreductase